MTKKEKAEEVVRRMGAYGVRPGPKYPELADAILRLLDVVDRRVAKKDAEIERLKACIEDAYREGWQQAAGYSDVYLDDLLDEDWGNSNAVLVGKETSPDG